ncbi:MAG: KTSC domain-containing protein [Sulfuritalea sp.]|nr:KTSC domain-containing protein [Sulfuritalea sp.]
MEMKQVNAGKLRAIGYDAGARLLRVEFDDRRLVDYDGVPQETWRRLSTAGSMWSYFRDNIEEEFTARRVK